MIKSSPMLAGFLAVVLLLPAAASAQWDVPSPGEAEHPGAEAAPVSSPTTYPDESGFEKRADLIMKGLADNDLAKWRRGYFAGGDPGKYMPGAAMAKLMLDPNDAEVRKYLNDDRSYKEHYHFAAVNWARFLPLFGEEVLTEETEEKLARKASTYSAYHSGGGTENHKVMWYTSAAVLPYYLEGERLGHMGYEQVLAKQKRWLRSYVKGLYEAGQGEWDSSTYLMFDVNGMLNIYDFSKDPQMRLLAKAALDWYIAGYALKYTDGVYCAPNQRGFASGPVKKIADRTGWLWWDSDHEVTADDTRSFLYTMHAVTSAYRPNRALCNVARKDLSALPAEQRNSKPNYWFGQGIEPQPNQMQESVYIADGYTMGSLWNGHGGQMTRFQLVADSDSGGIVFTGGHPRKSDHRGKIGGIGFTDGIGRYDQTAQVGRTHICLTHVPENDNAAWDFFEMPKRAGKYIERDGWWFIEAGEAYLALYGLGEGAALVDTPVNERAIERGRAPAKILQFSGRRTGFILETADASEYDSLEAFAKAVGTMTRVHKSAYSSEGVVTFVNLDGRNIRVDYQEDDVRLECSVDGEPVTFNDWPVYGGPFVTCEGSVLTVSDGKEGFTVDFSGDMPVYKPMK